MESANPARLYAAAAGLVLFTAGLAGFFVSLSWLNFLHLVSGALALVLAGAAARPLSLLFGLLYTGLALWGFADGGAGTAWGHLVLGLLGLAAFAGSSDARAQAAAEGA